MIRDGHLTQRELLADESMHRALESRAHALLKATTFAACYAARNLLDPLVRFEEVAILAYHSISDAPVETAVAPAEFDRQLRALAARGYRFVPLASVAAWVAGRETIPRKAVAITFDDGYADFETAALPILEQHGVSATLFAVGDAAGSREALRNDIPLLSAEALARVRARPLVEIGYHSRTHTNLAALRGDALARETAAASPARFFAYPGGKHSRQAAEALRQAGYDAACTIRPVLAHRGGDPYSLPRSVVLGGMPLWQVMAHASRAADWHRALRNTMRRSMSVGGSQR